MQCSSPVLSRSLAVLVAFACMQAQAADKPRQPVFSSPRITSATPGHAVKVDVDISGAKQLYLVVADAGDGYTCDWADWIEPPCSATRGHSSSPGSSGSRPLAVGRMCMSIATSKAAR